MDPDGSPLFLLHTHHATGDDPPRDRTAQLRSLGFPTRHLGPVQMTTDTALGVTKSVVQDKRTLRSPNAPFFFIPFFLPHRAPKLLRTNEKWNSLPTSLPSSYHSNR